MGHGLHVGMRVTTGGLDVRMSQEELYHTNISPGVKGKGSKGVAAGVRGKVAHRRFDLPEVGKKAVIITGEVPGMPDAPSLSTEHE